MTKSFCLIQPNQRAALDKDTGLVWSLFKGSFKVFLERLAGTFPITMYSFVEKGNILGTESKKHFLFDDWLRINNHSSTQLDIRSNATIV